MQSISLAKSPEIKTVHNNISATATATEISTAGFNAVLVGVNITGTGTWKIDLKGRLDSAGTVVDIYDNMGSQLSTGNLTSSQMRLFVGVPDLLTVVATEVVDGSTVTVRIQPINI